MSLVANESAPAPSAAENGEAFDHVIEPRRGWIGLDIPEMLRFRELLFFFVWRDVKVRYKQTVLGVAWAILQPIFNIILFTWVFGKMAGFASRIPAGLAYPLWLYAAMLPWMLISTAIGMGGMSLVNAQNVVSKVYFPRVFVPAATIGGALVDMFFSLLMFGGMIVWYHAAVHWTVVLVPVLIVLTVMVGLGLAYVLSALTVTYRDFRFLMPFLSTALLYGSFIMIPSGQLSVKAHRILSINPIFGIANGWRSAVFGIDWRPMDLAESTVTAVLLLLVGLFYFRRTERRFADIA